MVEQAKANTPDAAELEKQIKEIGQTYGMGKDAQIKFALLLVRGAYHGKFSQKPDTHGQGVDDAQHLFTVYMQAASQSVVFDTKPPAFRKGCACARTCIKLGGMTRVGNVLAAVDDFVDERQKLRKKPENTGKLDDMYNAFLRYARAQLASTTLLNESQRREFMFKKVRELKSAVDIVESMRKQADSLINGTAAHNTVLDDSPQIKAIRGACTSWLEEHAKAKNKTTTSSGVTVAKTAAPVTAAVAAMDDEDTEEEAA